MRRRVKSAVQRILPLVVGFTMMVPSMASAEMYVQIKKRCQEEGLDQASAQGRNAWARRCGLMQKEDEVFYNSRQKYVTYEDFRYPTTEFGDCPPAGAHLVEAGVCNVAGCYTGSQRILFPGQYVPIRDAVNDRLDTLLTPATGWSLHDGLNRTTQEPVGAYVVGHESGNVLIIESANGHGIEVTTQHPLLSADGHIIKARDIVAYKTTLMTVEGPSLVVSVTSRPYEGLVYNIEPKSTRTLANIVFAEGFLNGSVRYQNEWAEDTVRLALRDKIDAASF